MGAVTPALVVTKFGIGGQFSLGARCPDPAFCISGLAYVRMTVKKPSFFKVQVDKLTLATMINALGLFKGDMRSKLPKPLAETGFTGLLISFAPKHVTLENGVQIDQGLHAKGNVSVLGFWVKFHIACSFQVQKIPGTGKTIQVPNHFLYELEFPPIRVGGFLEITRSLKDTTHGPFWKMDIPMSFRQATLTPPGLKGACAVRLFGNTVETSVDITLAKIEFKLNMNLFNSWLRASISVAGHIASPFQGFKGTKLSFSLELDLRGKNRIKGQLEGSMKGEAQSQNKEVEEARRKEREARAKQEAAKGKGSCTDEEDEEEALLEELAGRTKTSRRLLGYSRNKILSKDIDYQDIAEAVGSRRAENDLSLSHRAGWPHVHHRHRPHWHHRHRPHFHHRHNPLKAIRKIVKTVKCTVSKAWTGLVNGMKVAARALKDVLAKIGEGIGRLWKWINQLFGLFKLYRVKASGELSASPYLELKADFDIFGVEFRNRGFKLGRKSKNVDQADIKETAGQAIKKGKEYCKKANSQCNKNLVENNLSEMEDDDSISRQLAQSFESYKSAILLMCERKHHDGLISLGVIANSDVPCASAIEQLNEQNWLD